MCVSDRERGELGLASGVCCLIVEIFVRSKVAGSEIPAERYHPECHHFCSFSVHSFFRMFDTPALQGRRHASSGALGDSQKRASSVAARASTDSVIHEDKENGDSSSSGAASSAAAAPLAPASSTRSNTTTATAQGASKAGNNAVTTTMSTAVAEALKLKLKEAELKQSGLSLHIEGVEKERTFYFSKLQVR